MKTLALLLLVVLSFSKVNAAVDPDNTAINQRDQKTGELTADQQSMSRQDMEMTQKVRQAIMKDKIFSTYAQNIKVITVGSAVTLKGPVRSAAEQKALVQTVKAVIGSAIVINETEVIR